MVKKILLMDETKLNTNKINLNAKTTKSMALKFLQKL